MKNTKTLALFSLAAIAGIGLVGCASDEPGASSSVEPASSSVSTGPTASAILNELTDTPVAMGTAINLDDYITVRYSDGSTDKNFTVSSNSAEVVIDGHNVTVNTVGQFTLDVASADGNRNIRVTLDVRSQENIEIIEFLAPLAEDDLNYTVTFLDSTYSYDGKTVFHTQNYGISYNVNNPGEVYSDGSPSSFAIGYLSDGNAYTGYFNENDQLVFEPGTVTANYGNYFLGGLGVGPDPLSFQSRVNDEGEVEVYGGEELTQNILYGCSYPYDQVYPEYVEGTTTADGTYFLSYDETTVLGLVDLDGDGTKESLLVVPFFNLVIVSSGVATVRNYYLDVLAYSNLGTTSNSYFEAAAKDPSYIPTKITPTPVMSLVDKAQEAGNYTVIMDLYASDASGNKVESPDTTYAFTAMFRDSATATTAYGVSQTTKVTADGIYATFESDDETTYDFGYFNSNGAGYHFATKEDEQGEYIAGEYEVEAVSGVTDVLTTYSSWTAASLVDGDFTSLNLTGESTQESATYGTVYTTVGDVGDNDGTTQGNGLFQHLFDQFTAISWTEQGSTTSVTFGTYMAEAVDFTSGDKHALTIYSEYAYIRAYEDMGILDIVALVYLPIGGDYTNRYMVAHYMLGSIGTTTATFPEVPSAAA